MHRLSSGMLAAIWGVMKVFPLIAILLSLNACGQFVLPANSGSAGFEATSNQAQVKVLTVQSDFRNQVWSELRYTISGNGDLEFTITPHSGHAEFLIHVVRANFQTRNLNIVLTPDDSFSLYASIADIFDNTISMQSVPSNGSGISSQVLLSHPAVADVHQAQGYPAQWRAGDRAGGPPACAAHGLVL